jgi:hypothetical protein
MMDVSCTPLVHADTDAMPMLHEEYARMRNNSRNSKAMMLRMIKERVGEIIRGFLSLILACVATCTPLVGRFTFTGYSRSSRRAINNNGYYADTSNYGD